MTQCHNKNKSHHTSNDIVVILTTRLPEITGEITILPVNQVI